MPGRQILKEQQGGALLIVLLLLAVMSLLGLALLEQTAADKQISKSSSEELQAWYAAENQAEQIIAALQQQCGVTAEGAQLYEQTSENAAGFVYDIKAQATVGTAVRTVYGRVGLAYDPTQYFYQMRQNNLPVALVTEQLTYNGQLQLADDSLAYIKEVSPLTAASLISAATEPLIGSAGFVPLQLPGAAAAVRDYKQMVLDNHYDAWLAELSAMADNSQGHIYYAAGDLTINELMCRNADLIVVDGTAVFSADFLPLDAAGQAVMPVIIAERIVLDAPAALAVRAYLLALAEMQVTAATSASVEGHIWARRLLLGSIDAAAAEQSGGAAQLTVTADCTLKPFYLLPDVAIIYWREKNNLL